MKTNSLLTIVGCLLMLSPSAFAGEGPDDLTDCTTLRAEIDHYSDLLESKRGTTKQRRVWRKFRLDIIGRSIYMRCSIDPKARPIDSPSINRE